jgi:hypothetical protein
MGGAFRTNGEKRKGYGSLVRNTEGMTPLGNQDVDVWIMR